MTNNVQLKISNPDEWIAYIESLKLRNGVVTIEEALNFDFKFEAEPILYTKLL